MIASIFATTTTAHLFPQGRRQRDGMMDEIKNYKDSREFFATHSVEITTSSECKNSYLVCLENADANSRASRQSQFKQVLEKLQPNHQEQVCGLLNKATECGEKVKLSLLLAIGAPIESIFIVYASRNTRVPTHLSHDEFCFRSDAVSVVLEDMAVSSPQRICNVEYTLENPDVIIETKVRCWSLINKLANPEFGKKRVPAGRRKRGNPVLNVSNFNVRKLRTHSGRKEFCTLFRQSWKTSLASAFQHKEIMSRLKDPTTDHTFAPWALALFDMEDKQNPESLQQLHSFFHDISVAYLKSLIVSV